MFFIIFGRVFLCSLRPIFGSHTPDKNSSKFTIFDIFFNSYHSAPKFIYSAAYMVLKQTAIV